MGDLVRDLRLAWRQALKHPGFTLAAVLTLGLGIGAATAVFGMVDAILLRPLPFHDQDRLVSVWGEIPQRSQRFVEISIADYDGWRDHNQVFSDLALVTTNDADVALTGQGEPLHVRARLTSDNLFQVLGAQAFLGRTFLPGQEDRPGTRVALLSYGFWQRHFASDPGVVGRKVLLDGDPHIVVGVMPRDFHYPDDAELWTTLSGIYASPGLRDLRIFHAVGRLRPGATLEQARQDLIRISSAMERERPLTNRGFTSSVLPLAHEILGDTRPALLLLLGAVGLLLLIACANVAGLLLARAASRQKETAIRTVLGAPRARIICQLLTESLLLAVLATALGLLLAWAGLRVLETIGPADIPRLDQVGLDARVAAFSLLAAVVTAGLFGLAPAFQTASPDLAAALKEGGKSSASRRTGRLRNLLVAGEVALALVVLVMAGLVIRSFAELERTDLGFRPQNLLTFRLTLYGNAYPEKHDWANLFQSVLARVRALPGVESASLVLLRPLSGPIGWDYDFTVEGQTADEEATNPTSNHERVSPGYFATLGIPLLRGRDFASTDTPDTQPVVIVNKSTAERFWPGQDPLGKRLRWGRFDEKGGPWLTVVGVVGDARYRAIESVRPDLYIPFLQRPHWAMDVVVRTAGDPLRLARPVAAAVRSVDPGLPVANLTTLEREIEGSVARPRLRTLILGLFAGLSLLLAAVGLYGIIAYSVAQRGQEIGIRMALGADCGNVLRLVLSQGLGLTLAGLAAGLAGASAVAATGW
ncbi:MAG TPA: ABC transporter permease, partial [Thermoanaerobaculia bacterium]|nr:ABC transporter permease [Thermoanaerobaculia bacterium]